MLCTIIMVKRATVFELVLPLRDSGISANRWLYGALRAEILEAFKHSLHAVALGAVARRDPAPLPVAPARTVVRLPLASA